MGIQRQPRRRHRLVALAIVPLALLLLGGSTLGRASGLSFSTVYVDNASGGGEPFVIYSHAANDLVYSAHEGTTLTKSGNAPGGTQCDLTNGGGPGVPLPPRPDGYLCSYNNQVNIWYSSNSGQTWTKSLGNPTATGFSDPSLSEDECTSGGACNVYDTGIDLINDALYASADGGQTWVGTPQCPPNGGDRPWLAGGKNGEVFLATNANVGGHTIYRGTVTVAAGMNVAVTCATTGITDSGGLGQIYYNHHDGNLLEPKLSGGKIGVGVLVNASAFTGTFLDHATTGPAYGSIFAHWPAIAISTDAGLSNPKGTIYAVWDTGPRTAALPHNGCSGLTGSAIGGNTLLQNAIMLTYSQDEGATWSTPLTIANSGGTVQWPWIAAGANGNVSVVWYQGNQVSDPDCDSANIVCTSAGSSCPTQWSIAAANIYGVTSGTPSTQIVNAVQNFDGKHANGAIHVGGICEGGTTCVATGEDRRIGDYFTNALDQNGCVMIASGDTMQNAAITNQPLPNSLPVFVKQVSGPSLTTGLDCAGFAANIPEAQTVAGLAAIGAVAVILTALARRRRASLAS